MADILTTFKKQLDNFPKNGGDFNIICSITYGEYMIQVALLDALLMPQAIVKRNLEDLVTTIDNSTYNTVISGLNKLDKTLKSVLPEPFNKNMTMDLNVGKFGDMISSICADFLGSLPESLFNIFQDIKHGMVDIASLINGALALPSNLIGNITTSLMQLKDKAMKEMLGTLFDTVLSPLLMYEDFLKENGVPEILAKMKKTEACMTKPGICNRPRADFIHAPSKKVYSAYYQEQFLVSSNGSINIKSFGGTSAQKSKVSNILKNMNSFRLTVH